MIRLSRLFHMIDQFYKAALYSYSFMKTAQYDEDDEYMDGEGDLALTAAGNKLPEKYATILDDIRNINQLYKEVIENKRGYASLHQYLLNYLDELDDNYRVNNRDLDGIKEVIDLMTDELKSLMGGSVVQDSPEAQGWFRVTKNNVISQSYVEAPEEESAWQQEVGAYEGTEEEEEGKTKLKKMYDSNIDTDDKSKPTGVQTIKAYIPRKLFEKYNLLKKRYADNLNPALLSDKAVPKVKNIINIINKILPFASEYDKLESKLILEVDADKTERDKDLKDFDDIKSKIAILDEERERESNALYRYIKQYEAEEYEQELLREKDANRRFTLEQKILLRKSEASRNVGKEKANRLRRRLIKMCEAGNYPHGKTLEDILKEIEEAEKGIKTPEQIAADVRELRREAPQEREFNPETGRRNKRTIINWAGMPLEGAIKNLSEALFTERKTVKDNIKKVLSEEYKSDLKQMEAASVSGDVVTLNRIINELKSKVAARIQTMYQFQDYIDSIQTSVKSHEFLGKLRNLAKKLKSETEEMDVNYIEELMSDAAIIVETFRGKPKRGLLKKTTGYEKLINYISETIILLQNIYNEATNE